MQVLKIKFLSKVELQTKLRAFKAEFLKFDLKFSLEFKVISWVMCFFGKFANFHVN